MKYSFSHNQLLDYSEACVDGYAILAATRRALNLVIGQELSFSRAHDLLRDGGSLTCFMISEYPFFAVVESDGLFDNERLSSVRGLASLKVMEADFALRTAVQELHFIGGSERFKTAKAALKSFKLAIEEYGELKFQD